MNLKYKRIYIASDHAGFQLKVSLLSAFSEWPWKDCGTFTDESVDYPDFAQKVVDKLTLHPEGEAIGVLICGSGQGMAMAANRNYGIRAALCWNEEVAKMARLHNNANVLCLGARFVDKAEAQKILNTFIHTEFEGGRHEKRVAKFSK